MSRKPIIALVGPDSCDKLIPVASELGKSIAEKGWISLTGGRNRGVMDAAAKGAKSAGGTTIGILPNADESELSEAVDIPIITGLGSARDNINALSSKVLVAVGMGPGTAAEVALSLKAGKHVVLLNCDDAATTFFSSLKAGQVHVAPDVATAMTIISGLV
eukprot:gene1616-33006_t